VPEAVVDHHESGAAKEAFGDGRVERWLRASYDWQRRRRGPRAARTYAALNLAGAAIRRDRAWLGRHWRAHR
jgi:hypothetical protein